MGKHTRRYELPTSSIGIIKDPNWARGDMSGLMRGDTSGRHRAEGSAVVDAGGDGDFRSEFARQLEARGDMSDWVHSRRFDHKKGKWVDIFELKDEALDVTPRESDAARADLVRVAEAEARDDARNFARPGYADLAENVALSAGSIVLDHDMYKSANADTELLAPIESKVGAIRARTEAVGRVALVSLGVQGRDTYRRSVHDTLPLGKILS